MSHMEERTVQVGQGIPQQCFSERMKLSIDSLERQLVKEILEEIMDFFQERFWKRTGGWSVHIFKRRVVKVILGVMKDFPQVRMSKLIGEQTRTIACSNREP